MRFRKFLTFMIIAAAGDVLFLFILMAGGFGDKTFRQLWPALALITGAALFVAGSIKPRKNVTLSYYFPSLIFIVLGIISGLFSLGVIKASVRHIALVAAPFCIVLAGVFLTLLYYKRRDILHMLPKEVQDDITQDLSDV